jgi:hypothetical protein
MSGCVPRPPKAPSIHSLSRSDAGVCGQDTQDAVEIRLLCDHREVLVNERTRLINRLRINLVILDPELEATIPARKLDYPASCNGSHGV